MVLVGEETGIFHIETSSAREAAVDRDPTNETNSSLVQSQFDGGS